MEKIKIITDSTADLPEYILKKYDIEVLPLIINFGEESYRDGIDIDIYTLFNKMENSSIFSCNGSSKSTGVFRLL